jgi:2-C-methyl-D-erythritol 4-phosphate cytidylyltransferase
VSPRAADVEAIIQAAGRGLRLGLGPKAFVELGGCSLLERAVTTMLSIATRVIVAVPSADRMRAERLVGGGATRVITGGMRRIDTLRALVGATSAPWLVLHDVVHPFVTPELSRRVLDEARRSGAAAAVLSNVDFLYGTDGVLRAGPGEVVAIQKPVAFRRADIAQGFALMDRAASGAPVPDEGVLEILALAGRRATFTPGHCLNRKLTTPEDLELARRLAPRG